MAAPAQAILKRQRQKNVIGLLLTPIVLYLLLRFFEYAQVYHPRTELIAEPESIHPAPEKIFLSSGGSYRINAWFFPALTSSEWSDWVVLVSHGNGGNISYRLPLYELWLEAGFNVMAYDYRGYGLSSGRPSEKGTYEDAEQALIWLQEKGFAPSRTISLGESLGGAIATEMATRHPLAGLVLQSTFTRIVDIGKELFPWLPVETLSAIRYDTVSKLPELAVPVLILHSREDGLIPFHHAERNFEGCHAPKLLGELEGDHNNGVNQSLTLYAQHIADFKKLLRPEASITDSSPPKE